MAKSPGGAKGINIQRIFHLDEVAYTRYRELEQKSTNPEIHLTEEEREELKDLGVGYNRLIHNSDRVFEPDQFNRLLRENYVMTAESGQYATRFQMPIVGLGIADAIGRVSYQLKRIADAMEESNGNS